MTIPAAPDRAAAVRGVVHGAAATDLVARLRAAGCVAAEEEAALLLEAAAGGHGAGNGGGDAGRRGEAGLPERLERLVARREAGEPLAWIVGWAAFLARRVAVVPGVYVPRPHTEALAERAAALLPAGGVAVDLCCGAGAVAAHLAAAVPTATVVALDLDPLAVRCAAANGVGVLRADVGARPPATDGVAVRSGVVDVVTAVPPYVPTGAQRFLPADVQRHEPALALDGGVDGLDVARSVVVAAARLLRPGGHLLVELGADQDAGLAPALTAARFGAADPWQDADGDLRGLHARREAT